jgi:hypothetical protein
MDFARIYGQVDDAQRLDAEEGLGDTSHLEDWITHRASGRVTRAPLQAAGRVFIKQKAAGGGKSGTAELAILRLRPMILT